MKSIHFTHTPDRNSIDLKKTACDYGLLNILIQKYDSTN